MPNHEKIKMLEKMKLKNKIIYIQLNSSINKAMKDVSFPH